MIRPAVVSDSFSIAKLHTETLTNSFLASLGLNFLSRLYVFIIRKEKIWIYQEKNELKGFVSYSDNSAGMMKRFLINCPCCLLLLFFKTLFQPAILKRFIETFRAPSRTLNVEKDKEIKYVPSCELLSISVSSNCQATGIGSQLVETLEEYLRQNQIFSYKVVAGEELAGANKFYLKNGFILTSQIRIHKDQLSNVYIKNILKQQKPNE